MTRESDLLTRYDRRIRWSFGAIVLILMIIVSGVAISLSSLLSQKQDNRLSGAIATILGESISRVSFSGKYHARLFVEEMKSRVPDLEFISVETSEGMILAHSDPTRDDTLITDPVDNDLRRQSIQSGTMITQERIHGGIAVKEVIMPYRSGIGAEVIGVVRIGINFNEARKEQRINIYRLLILIAILTILAIWGIHILSRRFGYTVRTLAMQLQGILNHAPLAIAITDKEGRVPASSVIYNDTFGHPAKDVTQRQLLEEYLSEAVIKDLAETDRIVFESGMSREREMVVDIHGESRVWNISKFPIAKDEEGRATLICTFIHDVSEQKRAEEQLRIFMESVENSSDAVGMSTPEGKHYYQNQAFNELFGPIGENPPETVYVDPAVGHEVFRAIMAGGQWTGEAQMYARDRRILDILLRAYANKDKSGRITTLVGIHTDISERKQAEEKRRELEDKLQRSEKMEALGTLAGGVAHDLNNTLGIIVGYSELLSSGIDKSSPLQSKVANIMKGGERAAAIVQDLLTLARRGVQTRSVVNINDIIRNFLKTPEYERILSYNPRMQVNADLPTDILNIMGSPIHLHKTVMNLLSNASEAMPHGGSLNIKTSNQYLDKAISGYDYVREGEYVVFSISDTGDGISPDNIRHIFEPFYTKKAMGRSGTGLGLAVVWGTVKDHDGYIDVQSEEGKGTTFNLYFPVTREEISVDNISLSLPDYKGKGESVLVVDDVKEQRDLASEMLSRLSYSVSSFSSGEEAVEYLKTNSVDILILDMIMDPGMDGLDTYKEIIKLYPGQKAIIVSGYSETDRVREAQSLGAGTYVKKPYVMERLGLAVRKELDRK